MTTPRFKVYVDTAGEYRWYLVSPNGKKLADSGEGYQDIRNCMHAIGIIKAHAAKAPVDGVQQSMGGLFGLGRRRTILGS
jgi:uncharacterized protein YegP (UPF0339 family)